MTAEQRRKNLQIIWQAALAAVSGEQAVRHAIEADIEADIKADTTFQPDQIIAIGVSTIAGDTRIGQLGGLEHLRLPLRER